MRHILRLHGHNHAAALAGPAHRRELYLDGAKLSATLTQNAGSAATLTLNGQMTQLHIANSGDHYFIHCNGEVHEVEVLEPLSVHASHGGAATGLQTHAPMPGSVVAIPASIGDTVRAGDTVVIIESMKLEVSLRATQPGRVASIGCAIGGTFEKDAVLVTLTAEGAP